jgi:hypothetical protein
VVTGLFADAVETNHAELIDCRQPAREDKIGGSGVIRAFAPKMTSRRCKDRACVRVGRPTNSSISHANDIR